MKNIKYTASVNTFGILLSIFIFAGGCKKYVTVPPPHTQVSVENLFSGNEGALAAAGGIYNTLATPDGFATDQFASVTLMGGLSSDELNGLAYPSGSDPYQFFTNSLQPANGSLRQQLWTKPYNIIYMCNSLLEGLAKSANVADSIKSQLEGEAKFMRAFLHFYLVNMYGNVPLVTTTDWKTNAAMPQAASPAVYESIIQDLEDAKNLVSENYLRSSERLYVNKGVVRAFLSKVYLYVKNWQMAETEATAVIDNGLYDLNTNLNNVFLVNSPEIIWQLKPIEDFGTNTQEGQMFILQYDPNYNPFLSDELLQAFEDQDQRRTNWISSYSNGTTTWYFPFKYKLNSSTSTTLEYSVVMRLSEVYLIRAEARAELNKIAGADGAAADLDQVRARAGLMGTTASTHQQMLEAIYHERQVEMFTEWGNRWFDLKRWGLSDNILSGLKGPNWQLTDTIYPIPQVQIVNNPATVQNPGYQ